MNVECVCVCVCVCVCARIGYCYVPLHVILGYIFVCKMRKGSWNEQLQSVWLVFFYCIPLVVRGTSKLCPGHPAQPQWPVQDQRGGCGEDA